jgi:hypothetical protein
MPIVMTDLDGLRQIAVALTDGEKALIRGMNFQGRRKVYGTAGSYPTNIAALYFDGPELERMVAAKNSVDKVVIYRK